MCGRERGREQPTSGALSVPSCDRGEIACQSGNFVGVSAPTRPLEAVRVERVIGAARGETRAVREGQSAPASSAAP